MLTIYGDRISGNCLKVKWTADYLKLPYKWVHVDIVSRETRTAHFLTLNPFGQVPVVQLTDGRTLGQSNAIILHLAEMSSSDLVPQDAVARAKMYEWLFWEQYSHETAIAVRRFQKHVLKKSDSDIDPNLIPKGIAALQRMETALKEDEWIAGDLFTLADIALVAYTRVAHEGGFDLTEFPKTRTWITRVEERLGFE